MTTTHGAGGFPVAFPGAEVFPVRPHTPIEDVLAGPCAALTVPAGGGYFLTSLRGGTGKCVGAARGAGCAAALSFARFCAPR